MVPPELSLSTSVGGAVAKIFSLQIFGYSAFGQGSKLGMCHQHDRPREDLRGKCAGRPDPQRINRTIPDIDGDAGEG